MQSHRNWGSSEDEESWHRNLAGALTLPYLVSFLGAGSWSVNLYWNLVLPKPCQHAYSCWLWSPRCVLGRAGAGQADWYWWWRRSSPTFLFLTPIATYLHLLTYLGWSVRHVCLSEWSEGGRQGGRLEVLDWRDWFGNLCVCVCVLMRSLPACQRDMQKLGLREIIGAARNSSESDEGWEVNEWWDLFCFVLFLMWCGVVWCWAKLLPQMATERVEDLLLASSVARWCAKRVHRWLNYGAELRLGWDRRRWWRREVGRQGWSIRMLRREVASYQCWTGIMCVWHHWVINNEDFILSDAYGCLTVFLFSMPFGTSIEAPVTDRSRDSTLSLEKCKAVHKNFM